MSKGLSSMGSLKLGSKLVLRAKMFGAPTPNAAKS